MISLKELIHNRYIIYCDMDSVLVDFDRGYKKLTGYLPNDYEKIHGVGKFWEPINDMGVNFWANLKWMSDGRLLWYSIKKQKPYILTTPSKDPSSRIGKLEWIKKNIPSLDPSMVIFSSSKYKYAGPNKILIDDRPSNIDPWIAAGGIGILHTSTQTTLKELEKFI